jgi:hypothetical protein
VPQRQSCQFVVRQRSIAVVVERAQRFVAVLPEHPERDAAEHLQR